MAPLSALLLLFCTFCCLVRADDLEDGFEIASHRDTADRQVVDGVSMLRKGNARTGRVRSAIGSSLYWFGHFNVGDSPHVNLLIDTGSSDLILNNGLYKPSKFSKPYEGKKNFSITYEGVNRAGFGFETINGTVYMDRVKAGGLTVKDQAVAVSTSYKYFDSKQLSYANPGQGIIGFLGPGSSSFQPGAASWFVKLANEKVIKNRRFGLAFGTSGKGLTILGKLAKRLITGDIITLPRIVHPYDAYTVLGDVTINNEIVASDQVIIMDVGTDNIQGPVGVTKNMFEILGWESKLNKEAPTSFNPGVTIEVLDGYFPCNKPPTIGFRFPAQSTLKKGDTAKIFNVSPLVWDVFRHPNSTNCTSILGGTNALTSSNGNTAWLLGQPFFAGHYIDFDITHPGHISFADLKDPSMESFT